MNWFTDLFKRSSTGGKDGGPNDGLSTDISRVSIRNDGFTIHGEAMKLRAGDSLYIAYRSSKSSSDWKCMELVFLPQSESEMFVFTGSRVEQVVVVKKADVERAASAKRVSVQVADDSLTTIFSLDELLNPLGQYALWSPFSTWDLTDTSEFERVFSKNTTINLSNPATSQDIVFPEAEVPSAESLDWQLIGEQPSAIEETSPSSQMQDASPFSGDVSVDVPLGQGGAAEKDQEGPFTEEKDDGYGPTEETDPANDYSSGQSSNNQDNDPSAY